MRKLLLMALLFMTMCEGAIAQKKERSFVITGELKGVNTNEKLFLTYQNEDKPVRDSATLKNGKFKFAGEVDGPQTAYIFLKGDKNSNDIQEFYIEPSAKISFTGNRTVKDASISGGKTQNDYVRLNKNLKPLKQQRETLQQTKNKTKDTAELKRLDEALQINFEEITKVKIDFLKKNSDSYVSLDILAMQYMGAQMRGLAWDPATFGPLYNSLSDRLKNTTVGKALGEILETARNTAIGAKALDFTQNDPQGNPVRLSQFKGKYVLIDFWASWCSPCRAENPNVLKAWERFKDKNFQIIGVSLDSKKENWVKAIETDQLKWVQVSDLGGWKNAVAVQYGVTGVPQNFLLDPNGIIIAQNLRGEALTKKLAELLENASVSN